MTFGKRLSELRKEMGISQAELAKLINVSTATIAMYETDKRYPSITNIEALADYFNVDIDYLYCRTDLRKKIHLDEDGKAHYYLDEDAAEMAEFLFRNEEYKVLLDASRKISKEDLKCVIDIIERMRKK